MRPRNILTQTNDMRRLMGLPLINEVGGQTIKDIKKKIITEDRAFSLGFGKQGGFAPMEDNVMQEEDIDETTEAEDFRDEGVGKEPLDKDLDEPINEIEKAQKMAEERALKEKELKEAGEAIGDGEDGMGEAPLDQVTEGSFAQYNITEGWFDRKDWDKQVTRDVGDKEPNDDIKKDVKRIISFLTPGEGDEIEGKYMDNIYPAMAFANR